MVTWEVHAFAKHCAGHARGWTDFIGGNWNELYGQRTFLTQQVFYTYDICAFVHALKSPLLGYI